MAYTVTVLNRSENAHRHLPAFYFWGRLGNEPGHRNAHAGAVPNGTNSAHAQRSAPICRRTLWRVLQITAVSSNNPASTAQLSVQHKIPGRILFVDDDRFYDQTDELTAALDSLNISYDSWDTEHDATQRNGPPFSLLQHYDFVIWYTGYDWFQPITPTEREVLETYLAQGGRLFLTSQDFLYYHSNSSLARDYFGVADYLETVEPTQLIGSGHTAVSPEAMMPISLNFDPYQNHGDGIIPAPHSQPFFWHDRALPAGTATSTNQLAHHFLGRSLFETISPTPASRSDEPRHGLAQRFGRF